MLKAKVSRDNLDYEVDGNSVTILADLACLAVSVVDEVCEKANLDKEIALNAFFRAVREGFEVEGEGE